MIGMHSSTGKSSTDEIEHIQQSISDVLLTPIASRVMRRSYGSLIPRLLDQPLNAEMSLLLYSAALIALMRWEPRILISRILLSEAANTGTANLTIEGSIKSTGKNVNLTIPIGVRI